MKWSVVTSSGSNIETQRRVSVETFTAPQQPHRDHNDDHNKTRDKRQAPSRTATTTTNYNINYYYDSDNDNDNDAFSKQREL